MPGDRESRSAAGVQQSVPFLLVSNMQESVSYYVAGLGFELAKKWIDQGRLRWCWLQHGGAALMLQELPEAMREQLVSEGKALGLGVSIYFICEDALAMYREVIERGLAAKRPFVGNRMWVTGVEDPDGYKLFFESSTDAPEESEYSAGDD
jgi:catechol 2,3-dioxygenase-like lactoylglutathione lyase family enzyme